MFNRCLVFDEVFGFLESSYERNSRKKFNDVQKAILRAAWDDVTYHEVVEVSDYSYAYITNKAAPDLWRKLGIVFGTKITKKNLRNVIERIMPVTERRAKVINQPDTRLPTLIGKLPQPLCFVGREAELHALSLAIAKNQCIVLTGTPGIGKSSLASAFLKQQSDLGNFKACIWKYCFSENPQLDIQDLMGLLTRNGAHSPSIPTVLRDQPLLICLDGVDIWLKTHRRDAETLIQQLVETHHDSCIILTSSQPMTIVDRLVRDNRPISSLFLKGLSTDDARSIMRFYDLDVYEADTLHKAYQGNPQLLHLAYQKIKTLFRGNTEAFLKTKTSFASDALREFLNNLFNLSDGQILEIDRFVLDQLVQATSDAPISFGALIAKFQNSSSVSLLQIQQSVEKLASNSLIFLQNTPEAVEIVVPQYVRKYVSSNRFELFSFETLTA
jgi:energy-coupling factor transporter ATP-binding protein EcfA2